MRILILGGTGAIGEALITELMKDTEVNIFVTSRKDRSSFSVDRCHFIQCNAKKIDSLKEILSKDSYDAIVDFLIYEPYEFQERYELLCSSTPHYIFLSSCRVLADSKTERLTEKSPRLIDVSKDQEFLGTSEYSLIKGREENLLMQSDLNSWTIIRPYITYNTNRLQLGVWEKDWWLYRAMNNRKILLSREIGERYTTLTYGGDVAKVIATILLKKCCKREIIHPVTSRKIKWKDVLDVYCDVLESETGKKPAVEWIDSMDVRLPGIVKYNKYQIIYDRALDRVFDNSKVLSLMPDSFSFVEPEDGLKLCLKEFLKNPVYGEIQWKMQAYMDIICKDKAKISEIKDSKMRLKYLIWRYTPYLRLVEKGIR